MQHGRIAKVNTGHGYFSKAAIGERHGWKDARGAAGLPRHTFLSGSYKPRPLPPQDGRGRFTGYTRRDGPDRFSCAPGMLAQTALGTDSSSDYDVISPLQEAEMKRTDRAALSRR